VATRPGVYALFCQLDRETRIEVGRLGPLRLRPGLYAYVGSALGPGGLRARLEHHSRLAAAPRWHIDYLRRHAAVERIWFRYGTEKVECAWASAMLAMGGAVLAPGFGSSDCRCRSHLFWFERMPALERFAGAPPSRG
jgi:Uri superfamily endonuclease